jgi:hypothetical protein
MSNRKAAALARSKAHNEAALAQATTLDGKLWRACAWLVSEARRADRVADTTRFLLDVIEQIRTGAFDPGLWRLCTVLIAEARRAGRAADVTRLLITATDQIRKESTDVPDRH